MTNESCLPRPTFLKSWKIVRIYLLFLLNLYLIYNQVYIHRSKRFVCSYFHPLREKQRIAWLYDKLLSRRKKAFLMMTQRIKDKIKVHGEVKQQHNFLQVSRRNYQTFLENYFIFYLHHLQTMLETFPRLCKCLECLSIARPKCFICNETQARKRTNDSIYYLQCQKKACGIVYCEHCWLEMGRKCLACKYRRKHEAKKQDKVRDADGYSKLNNSDTSEWKPVFLVITYKHTLVFRFEFRKNLPVF